MAERRTGLRARHLLGAGLLLAVSVTVLSPSTGADQVHLEAATPIVLPQMPAGETPAFYSMNRSGTLVGGTIPPAAAVIWPGGADTPRVEVPPGFDTAGLHVINDEGIAAGTAWHGATERPMSYDAGADTWTELAVPSGVLFAEADTIAETGAILGRMGDGSTTSYAYWADRDAVAVPVPGSGETWLLSDGRVVVVDGVGAISIWDPTSGTSVPIPSPDLGALVTVGGSGIFVFQPAGATYTEAWDLATGLHHRFDRACGLPVMSATGEYITGCDGGEWQLWSDVTDEVVTVAPFGRSDGWASMLASAVDPNGSVAGYVTDGAGGRAFVWNVAGRTVDLGTAAPGEVFAPSALDGRWVVGTQLLVGVPPTWWRATYWLAPDAPGGLAGSADGAAVALSWSAPRSVGDAPIDHYQVLSDGVAVAAVDPAATTWSASTTGTHAYTVVAVNAYGDSTPSNAVEVSAAAAPTAVTPAFTG